MPNTPDPESASIATIGEIKGLDREDSPAVSRRLVQNQVPSPARVEAIWQRGQTDKQRLIEEMWTNLAFTAGEQWVFWDNLDNRLIRRPPSRQPRMKINLIHPLYRGELATATENRPIPEVFPKTDDEADRMKARAANRALTHELQRLEFELLYEELMQWVVIGGSAYLHPRWDANEEEVAIDVVPPFEVVLDPGVRKNNAHKALWAIHGKVLSPDEAFERFGREFTPRKDVMPMRWHKMFRQPGGSRDLGKPGVDSGGVLVLRMWHRPSRKYPKGFVATIVNGQPVELTMDENEQPVYPFDHKQIPFIDFHHVTFPGRFEGQSVITQLIAPQKDYNSSRSRQAEIRSLHSAMKVLAPYGSLDEEQMTPEPGQVVKFRPVGPWRPEFVPPPPTPRFLFSDTQTAFGEMQNISSQHEVSRGQVPSSGMPAAAILALQEKDERKISTMIRRAEKAVGRVGLQMLTLMQQFWPDTKWVRTHSEDTGEMGVELLRRSDIIGQFDVIVKPGSAMPRSKGQLRQDILALWDRRLIMDPQGVLRALELPNSEGFLRTMDTDAHHARGEHDRIFRGETPSVETFHNHDVHIFEHNEFRKTSIFRQWQDELKAVMDEHVVEHEQRRDELMQEMLAQQQAIQGVQGQAGNASVTPEFLDEEPGAGEVTQGFLRETGAGLESTTVPPGVL